MQKVSLGLILSALVTGLDDTHPGEFAHGARGVARILANRKAYNPAYDKYNARQIAFAACKDRHISFPPQWCDSLHSVIVHNFDATEIRKFREKGESLRIPQDQPDFVFIECGFMAEYVNSGNESDVIMLA